MTEKEEKELLAQRVAIAKHCTWVGFYVNGMLAILKVLAGVFGKSSAMIADGIHSVSDFITDVIVIVFIGVSARGVNQFYRYGHGKFETFATMLISFALIGVAIGLFWNGLQDVISAMNGEELSSPTYLALIMALISIVTKEVLYQYTKRVGDKINSMALVANAWHHRSDAFSSIATLIGIGGAMFLGVSWRILDPLAAMLVSFFILMVGWRLGIPAIKELLEVSLPHAISDEIGREIYSVEGVKTYHNLRTRKNGNMYVLDFHIKVDPDISITEAHDISSRVERKLKGKYDEAIVNIHIEPYLGEEIEENGCCVD